MAKQFVLTFLETLTMQGKINPASSIFYLKNWGSYKDSISFDDVAPLTSVRQTLGVSDLPKLNADAGEQDNVDINNLPPLPTLNDD